MDGILVCGARTHNLQNIDLTLPKNQLVVITGLSGSGKSSLAFDTLYAEGQRRYVESLPGYARQFLARLEKPDVDKIEGLSPAIAIEQKATNHNPRSTVGTVTEIHDYLRLLWARAGTPFCPEHQVPLAMQSIAQMVDTVLGLPENTKVMILSPMVKARKGEYSALFENLRRLGFVRARIDGAIYELDQLPKLKKNHTHTVDLVVDRLKVKMDSKSRLAESFETALKHSDERAVVVNLETEEELLFCARFACPFCNFALPELSPRLFSFNSPTGACETCSGLGVMEFVDEKKVVLHPEKSLSQGAIKGWGKETPFYFQMMESLARHYHFSVETPFCELPEAIQKILLEGSNGEKILFAYKSENSFFDSGKDIERLHPFEGVLHALTRRYQKNDSESLAQFISHKPCPDCLGARLNHIARNVKINQRSLFEVSNLSLTEAFHFFQHLKFSAQQWAIAEKIQKEVLARLQFLMDVGLNYLTLSRSAETLSGGEAQRIRLASQIGSGLSGVLYVLDEPSIGLHQRDNARLIQSLKNLRDRGNSVIVVEHDEETIQTADCLIDMGPGAGVHGGKVVAMGTPKEVARNPHSLTGLYLSGKKKIAIPLKRRKNNPQKQVCIQGASGNNLKKLTVSIPVGLFSCVTGVSGSGKSTLINETLLKAARVVLYHSKETPAPVEKIEGLDCFDKIIAIDQSPIGRTPRSNPATYTGLLTPIRELFAQVPAARERGYSIGRFSFNVKGGRCEACQGEGFIQVAMHFLPDVFVECEICQGKRYNRETLEIFYRGKNIHEILSLTVEEAFDFFKDIPAIAKKLSTLLDVGLSYIRLGQSATTFSGGEAQRVKLALELSKRDTGKTLYVLDEPTTGLHFADIDLLLKVLQRLTDEGNTVVVIEHNLDVIKCADWLIDLGPEGGDGGGTIIAEGTPEEIAQNPKSFTGEFLNKIFHGQR